MSPELIAGLLKFLGWCGLAHIIILLWWFLFLVFAHDWVYRLHSKWFRISTEQFDAIHYASLAGYKLIIFVFIIVPYLVLRLAF